MQIHYKHILRQLGIQRTRLLLKMIFAAQYTHRCLSVRQCDSSYLVCTCSRVNTSIHVDADMRRFDDLLFS